MRLGERVRDDPVADWLPQNRERMGVAQSAEWVRPSDWLTLPEASNSFKGLIAVFDDGSNYVALNAAGNYTVDWGDGSAAQNVNSGVAVTHQYTYSSLDSGTYCSRGYRQAIITVTPQSGQTFTTINLNVMPSRTGMSTGYSTGFLDVSIDGASLTGIQFAYSTGGVGNVKHNMLERVQIKSHGTITGMGHLFRSLYSLQSVPLFSMSGVQTTSNMFMDCRSLRLVPPFNTSSATSMNSMFNNCFSLETVPLFDTHLVANMTSMFQSCSALRSVPPFNTSSVTSMSSMFYGCYPLETVPLFDTSLVTTMSSMFSYCTALQSVPLFDTHLVANMSSMFSYCASLRSVPLFDTSSVTNMASMFNYCYALQTVPLFDTHLVNNMSSMFSSCTALRSVSLFNTSSVTTMNSMFANCYSLRFIPALDASAVTSSANLTGIFTSCSALTECQMTGFKYSFTMTGSMEAAELNAVYTGLATVTGQTITVTGIPGVDGDDPSIATAKGWTVTG